MDWELIGKDFVQKYKDTFLRVRFNENDTLHIVHVDEIELNPISIRVSNNKIGTIILDYQTDAEFDFTYPELGYFNYRGMAVLFDKRHQRQWRRGICDNTVAFSLPYSNWWGSGWNWGPSFGKLTAAFRPRPLLLPISHAIEMLDGGKFLSVPLSRDMALGLPITAKGKNYLLFFRESVIASVVNGKKSKTIALSESQFRQEVIDLLNQTGESHLYDIT